MSLSWDVTRVKNSDDVCFERIDASRIKKEDLGKEWSRSDDSTYVRLSPKTAALVWSTTQTGIREFTSSNIEEILYRLDALFDAGVAFLFARIDHEGMIPIRITREDVHIHTGLKTSAHPWGPQEFDKHVRDLRTQRQLNALLDPTAEL